MTEATITIEDLKQEDPDKNVKLVTVAGQLDESNVDEKSKIMYDLIEKSPSNLF